MDERRQTVEAEIGRWKRDLLRTTRPNNLLAYKDHRWATLPFDQAEPRVVERLLRGDAVSLTQLFVEEETRDKAAGSLRSILKRAARAWEEQGIETLRLALGMATWKVKNRANPCAPIMLHPIEVKKRGSDGRNFDLALREKVEVNPLLIYKLRDDHGLDIPQDKLLGLVTVAEDMPGIDRDGLSKACHALEEQAVDAVTGFATQTRVVLSTFSYENLPMVKDLEEHADTFVAHDLVAAVAGVLEVRQRLGGNIVVTPEELDELPVSDEYLVLDADSSQASLIAAARRGQNLVIQGPPGTGKSQTIANLLASAVADGKTALFVAQKRAAIDAVLDRLKQVDLGDIVLDLHSRTDSGRVLAQELRQTLEQIPETQSPGEDDAAWTLQARRKELNDFRAALHASRQPWDRSLFEVWIALARIPVSARVSHQWRGAALQRLDTREYQHASELVREYVQARGLEVLCASPWAGADIRSNEHVQETLALLRSLVDRMWPELRGTLDDFFRMVALSPVTLADCGEMLGYLTRLREAGLSFGNGLWDTDLQGLADALSPACRGSLSAVWSLLSSSRYRRARKKARVLVNDPGASTRDLASAVRSAAAVVAWWRESHDAPPPPLSGLPTFCETYGDVSGQLATLARILGQDLFVLPMAQVQDHLDRLHGDRRTVPEIPGLRALEDKLRAADLWDFVDEVRRSGIGPDHAREALEYAWLASLQDWILSDGPRLATFQGRAHATVAEFVEADVRHLSHNRLRVRYRRAQRAHNARQRFADQVTRVKNIAGRKSGTSVRALLRAAPNLVTELRPCWTMSPLLVARWLPATAGLFDLVVFDEASQVRPEDAVGAILRGKQVVVAGDSHQLPPSNWFVGQSPENDDEDETSVGTSGHESILTVLDTFLPGDMLRWHYRSRDERLIAVANDRVYDNKLVTFPGAHTADVLRHELVEVPPGQTSKTAASSHAEVTRVIQLIQNHVRTHSDESLGVITMGDTHLDEIEGRLRQERANDPDLDDWLTRHDNRFFLKNLERVQGDERDAIILSMGFKLESSGVLHHRFGPLNEEGGERRLNVAITRAKERMTVVSAFSYRHIHPETLQRPVGAQLLQDFLRFAECGGDSLEDRGPTGRRLNSFEQEVKAALEVAGIPRLHAQYGVSTSTIDFVAEHRDRSGRTVLAIECDGDSYHRRPTARERDRLRQEHLERLGWRFHRFWASDWFRDRKRTVAGVMQAWQEACDAVDRGNKSVGSPRDERLPARRKQASQPAREVWRPLVPRKRPIGEYSHEELVGYARKVEDGSNGLWTEEETVEALFRGLLYERHGPEIMKRLRAAVAQARGTFPPVS